MSVASLPFTVTRVGYCWHRSDTVAKLKYRFYSDARFQSRNGTLREDSCSIATCQGGSREFGILWSLQFLDHEFCLGCVTEAT